MSRTLATTSGRGRERARGLQQRQQLAAEGAAAEGEHLGDDDMRLHVAGGSSSSSLPLGAQLRSSNGRPDASTRSPKSPFLGGDRRQLHQLHAGRSAAMARAGRH